MDSSQNLSLLNVNADGAIDELQAEREYREQFIATLTHDLRSPLTGIRMSAQLALRKIQDPEYVARQCSKIMAGVDRMDQLIQTILDVSLIRAGGSLPVLPKRTELRPLVQEIIEELITVHGNRFELEFKGESQAYVDRMGLRRALENLLQNAIKYGSPDTPVRLLIQVSGPAIRIEVQNHGNPIPQELLPTLFDPLRRGRGWGLGLTLVRGIVSAHGGQMDVTSGEAEGTRFVITLPGMIEPESVAKL